MLGEGEMMRDGDRWERVVGERGGGKRERGRERRR